MKNITIKTDNPQNIVIPGTNGGQSALYSRQAIIYALSYIVSTLFISFAFNVVITSGITHLKDVIISACCYVLPGIFFAFFLYSRLTFLSISNYTGGVTYSFIVFAGIFATSLLIGFIKGNVSVITCLYSSCLFFLPYTIYQTWLFYSKLLFIKSSKIWYFPEHTSQVPKVTVFLNSIHIKIRVAPVHGNAEEVYETTVPGRMTIGDMFTDFIINNNSSKEKKQALEDVGWQHFGWHFFTPAYLGLGARVIDADVSLHQNSIKNNAVIIAKHIPRQLTIA